MKKDKYKAANILMLIDSILKKNRFFETVDAEIYGYKMKLDEYQVRAIQVIVHNSTDKQFEEYINNIIIYSGPKRHEQMIFNRDGKFENQFESGFYDINSKLTFQILLNKI